MKRILLSLALLAAVTVTAFAQNANADTKLQFASKINELEAGLGRNRPQMAAEAYADLAGAMQQRLVALRSSDPARAAKAEKVYSEVKQQSANMQGNRAAIVTSLRSFLEFY